MNTKYEIIIIKQVKLFCMQLCRNKHYKYIEQIKDSLKCINQLLSQEDSDKLKLNNSNTAKVFLF